MPSKYAGRGGMLSWRQAQINGAVARFPVSWQNRLKRTLGAIKNAVILDRWADAVDRLCASERGGLRPDASDSDICQKADVTAQDFARRVAQWRAIITKGVRLEHLRERFGGGFASLFVAGQCRRLLDGRGMADFWPAHKGEIGRWADVARMCCPLFWRRIYRKLLVRTCEATAIKIGIVRRNAGLYCSNDAVKRSRAQDVRTAAVLADVVGVNDQMQAYTLAELAAKGVANQEIRRHELLTRIAGFELIAKDCGHIAFMVTVTCPSRFHAAKQLKNGRVVDNRKYAGDTPREGQEYLSDQWAKCRTAARAKNRGSLGEQWYGFRIAEPQHDGTPHWHLLLFMPATVAGRASGDVLREVFLRYFLENESPDEAGAEEYRVDFEQIDWAKGSAVGYVIKYVSKNIDGHGVGYDLEGLPEIESSQRVRAWARHWGIRQFQQIGGAPVGVWRELRRVHPENVPGDAPEALRACLSAMNVAKIEPGVQSLAWKKYNAAQGGVTVRRAALRVRLVKDARTEKTRYGEERPDAVVGVVADGVELFRNHIHEMNPAAEPFSRRVALSVESERAAWLMGSRTKAQALAIAAVVFQRSGEAASTRIHVNNCTAAPLAPAVSPFLPVARRRKKLRLFRRFDAALGRSPGFERTR